MCLLRGTDHEEMEEWTYFPAGWERRLLTPRHLLLWGIIDGEGVPPGKHTSNEHLLPRVPNCGAGVLGAPSPHVAASHISPARRTGLIMASVNTR